MSTIFFSWKYQSFGNGMLIFLNFLNFRNFAQIDSRLYVSRYIIINYDNNPPVDADQTIIEMQYGTHDWNVP